MVDKVITFKNAIKSVFTPWRRKHDQNVLQPPMQWKEKTKTVQASENPQGIKLAMSKVYKIDEVARLKHIAAQHKTSLSYRSRTEEAKRRAATKKQKQRYKNVCTDKSANFDPPDRSTNFSCDEASTLGKRARVPQTSGSPTKKSKTIAIDRTVQFIPNPRPDVLGKTVQKQFEVSGVSYASNGRAEQYCFC